MFPRRSCGAYPGWSWIPHLFTFNNWGMCCWHGIHAANNCTQEFCLFFPFLLSADRRQHKAMKMSTCSQREAIINRETNNSPSSLFCLHLITVSFKADCGAGGSCFETHAVYSREEKKYMSCVECLRIWESLETVTKRLWTCKPRPLIR